jgi:hypothetical protein
MDLLRRDLELGRRLIDGSPLAGRKAQGIALGGRELANSFAKVIARDLESTSNERIGRIRADRHPIRDRDSWRCRHAFVPSPLRNCRGDRQISADSRV